MIYKLYHGKSPYLSLKALRNELAHMSDISFQILEADMFDSQKIFDILNNQSLFETQRAFVIKRLYKNKDKDRLITTLLSFLQNQSSNDIFFFWEDQKLRPSKFVKFFKDNNQLEEHEELNKRTFYTWLKEEMKNQGVNISASGQRVLAQKTNFDPERCSNEIQRLKLNGLNDINDEDIQKITVDTLEEDIWGLIDSINDGDKGRSIDILEKLNSQNNDPNYILSMLARNLRLITLVKYLNEQGKSFKDICSILRIPPFTLPKVLESSKKYDMKRINTIYQKLGNLDLQIKTGKIDGMLGLTLICPYL